MVTRCLALAVLTLTACAAVGFAVAAGAWARHRKPAETTVVAAKAEQASASQRTPPAAPPSQPATNVNRKPRGYPESFRRVRPPVSVEVLKRDLASVPEILLEDKPSAEAAAISAFARDHHGTLERPAPLPVTVARLLDGLPKRDGGACYLSEAPARSLERLSEQLHKYISEVKSSQTMPAIGSGQWGFGEGADSLATRLALDGDAAWRVPEAVPTLVQILQAEETPYRRYLVQMLAGIDGEESTAALARRAAFDLSATVRQDAVYALRNRPSAHYREILLDAMRYPWEPAVSFASEALANLNDASAIPTLVDILVELRPPRPVTAEPRMFVRELVRINHLQNCLLCHAASVNRSDLVRAIVPDPDRPPPPSRQLAPPYYGGSSGIFVRADVTYLKQDFSVVHTVPNLRKRPPRQRFDYVVRTRYATAAEQDAEPNHGSDYARIDAIYFALRELTGEDFGRNPKAWEEWLRREPKSAAR